MQLPGPVINRYDIAAILQSQAACPEPRTTARHSRWNSPQEHIAIAKYGVPAFLEASRVEDTPDHLHRCIKVFR